MWRLSHSSPARRQNSHSTSTFNFPDFMVEQGLVTDPKHIDRLRYYPQLERITGGQSPALFLSLLLYWRDKQKDPHGWLFKTQRELQQETGLTRWKQELAREKLRRRRILEECYADDSCHGLCYRINLAILVDLWRHHYGPPVKTSRRSQPPRRALVAVTSPAPPADASQPDPPQQADLLLSYETPQSPPPGVPRQSSSSVRVSHTPPRPRRQPKPSMIPS